MSTITITRIFSIFILVFGVVVMITPHHVAHAQIVDGCTSYQLSDLNVYSDIEIIPDVTIISVRNNWGIFNYMASNPFATLTLLQRNGDFTIVGPAPYPSLPTILTMGYKAMAITTPIDVTICNPIPAPTETPTRPPTGTPIPSAPSGCQDVIIEYGSTSGYYFPVAADVYSWNGTALWESEGPGNGGWVELGLYPTVPTRIQAGYQERFKARDASNNVQQMLVCDAVGGTPTPTAVPSTSCDPVGAWTPVADRGSGCSPAGPHEPASA